MNEESINKNAKPGPSDEEIAALLAQATGKDKRKGRDQSAPSPRMPEALYYYIFILVESALLMGVWGFMRLGASAVMRGPSMDETSVGRWVSFNISSWGEGIVSLLSREPWVPAAVMALALLVFVPVTPRQRKRAATLISTLIVAVFVLLIAMQFSEDMSNLTRSN